MKNWNEAKTNSMVICIIDGAIGRIKEYDGQKFIVGIRDMWPVEEFDCRDWHPFDLEHIIQRLNDDLGWSLPIEDETYSLDEEHGILSYGDHGTYWQVDVLTGESRHKGKGRGCFWTEWEGA